ncbi:MAG: UbiA-like polyprenyltransferase [Candidatus Caenarcaniphilales bacterium]|nr:UbiA-like polyprenyltransferase [Candidatus Caenarcaniphilales bacterium]
MSSILEIKRKIQVWSEMIKLEHTIFSAPFMLASMLIASDDTWPNPMVFFWCGLALFGARSSAMTLNRVIDAQIDAANPRTANRAIPAGKFTSGMGLFVSVIGFVLLTIAAFNLPRICAYLLPIAIIWLSLYSYVKRYSWLCHFVLGIALGGAVLGGWIAVTGSFSTIPFLLALAVSLWVSGFDILYATQDIDFDRKSKLYSVPSRFGLENSMKISQMCHFICVFLFVWVGYLISLGQQGLVSYGYSVGLICVLIGLFYQHKIINEDLRNVNVAFFNANAWISSLFFLCILISKILELFV